MLYADVDDRAKAAILGGTIRTLAQDVRWPVHGFLAAPADGQPDRRAAGRGPEPPQATADGLLAGRDPAPERAAPWLEAPDELRNPRRAPGEEGE